MVKYLDKYNKLMIILNPKVCKTMLNLGLYTHYYGKIA